MTVSQNCRLSPFAPASVAMNTRDRVLNSWTRASRTATPGLGFEVRGRFLPTSSLQRCSASCARGESLVPRKRVISWSSSPARSTSSRRRYSCVVRDSVKTTSLVLTPRRSRLVCTAFIRLCALLSCGSSCARRTNSSTWASSAVTASGFEFASSSSSITASSSSSSRSPSRAVAASVASRPATPGLISRSRVAIRSRLFASAAIDDAIRR